MTKTGAAAVSIALACAIAAFPGCSERRPVATDEQFTVLYAELMLLQEHERPPAVTDSAYRHHASALLMRNGTTEEEFRNRSTLLMGDDREWRDFLGRVSLVFDSIKTARALPVKQMPDSLRRVRR